MEHSKAHRRRLMLQTATSVPHGRIVNQTYFAPHDVMPHEQAECPAAPFGWTFGK